MSRFHQPDPYDGSYNLTDPQSLNRYAYVQNDPVNFVDPSGLFMISPAQPEIDALELELIHEHSSVRSSVSSHGSWFS